MAAMNGGRHQASASRRGAIETAVFDFGDQTMAAQFGDQTSDMGAALTLFLGGLGGSGIQMGLQVFVTEADQGMLA